MKKRFLLLTLIMCLLGGVNLKTLNAQETFTIIYNQAASNQYTLTFTIIGGGNTCSVGIPNYEDAPGAATEIEIPEIVENGGTTYTVVDIPESAFDGASVQLNDKAANFTKLTIPNTVTSIGRYAFYKWTGLKEVIFGSGLTNIANQAFDQASNIETIYCYAVEPPACGGNAVFPSKVETSAKLYVPAESLNNYKSQNYGNGWGYISPSNTFEVDTTLPTAPTLKSPADKATDQFNPTLSWAFGENTEEYQVLLAKASEDFPEVDDEKWTKTQNATEGSYTTTSGLERGTEYKWKVVTRNSNGETSSETYTFTTLDVPTAPTLNSPENGTPENETIVDINKPTLEFTLSNNTTQYQILLDKNENPTTVEKDWTTGKGDVSYQTSNLDTDATYYWKVIAKNDAGQAESDIFQFTTANIFPVTDYEIKLVGNNITLEWQYADQNANEYQVCFGGVTEQVIEWQYSDWKSRGTEAETLVEDGSFTIENADFGDKVYFRVDVREKEGETILCDATGATAFCVILDNTTDWGDSYNNADYVFVRANVRVIENITAKNITIENGGSLRTIMNNVVVSANTLVVNEGGQFFATDKSTYFPINTVIFNKKIANPVGEWKANNKTGWQFISSPFTDAPISDFVTTGEGNDYDLYKYDGSAEYQWVNHKDNELAEPFAPKGIFAQGIGYLASYETKDTLTFTGSNGSINRTNYLEIGQDGMMETPGIYLLGNPFLFNMDWVKISTNGAYGINPTSFVVVKADGAYEYKTSGEIKVGEGFFVLTTNDGATFNYPFTANDIVAAPSSKSRNAEQSKSLNIIATGNAGNDNVVVNFNGEGEGFPKLQNFNDDIATVYVQNNDANYGVYNCDENTTEVELCFNANQMGNYTISVEPTGEFSSIVLVDRFTGIETNLLVDDYHFTAMSEENNNRFYIRLGNGQQTTDNSHFAYVSGEDLIIDAEGTVQIIDMMGRVVYTSNVENNNRINVSDFNNGAYVVRVINENEVKVQKIIL